MAKSHRDVPEYPRSCKIPRDAQRRARPTPALLLLPPFPYKEVPASRDKPSQRARGLQEYNTKDSALPPLSSGPAPPWKVMSQPVPPPACDSSPSVKGVGRKAVLDGRAEPVTHLGPEVDVSSGGQHRSGPAPCCLTAKWRHHRSRKWRSTALGDRRRLHLVCSGRHRARAGGRWGRWRAGARGRWERRWPVPACQRAVRIPPRALPVPLRAGPSQPGLGRALRARRAAAATPVLARSKRCHAPPAECPVMEAGGLSAAAVR